MDENLKPTREYIAHLEHLFQERQENKESEEKKKFQKMVAELISVISHEMRTPLSVAFDGVVLVSEGMAGKLTPQQKEYLKIANRGLERLRRIIENMLDLTRIEEGKFNLQKKILSANSLGAETIQYYQFRAKDENKKLIFNCPEVSSLIFADHDRILQVLMNFVDNAFKFASSNAKIELNIVEKEKELEFSISDTGYGIPKEELGKIFNRFLQLNKKEIANPGLGLGLTISREIIHAHGGKIWAESVVKMGSRFVFTLPKLLPFFPELENFVKSKKADQKIIKKIREEGIIKTLIQILENPSLEIDFKEAFLEKFQQTGLIKGIVPTIYDHIHDFTRLKLPAEKKNLAAQNYDEAFLMAYIEKNMGQFQYQGKAIYEYGDINHKRMALISLVKEMDAKSIVETLEKLEAD